jgi:hypothetical protein
MIVAEKGTQDGTRGCRVFGVCRFLEGNFVNKTDGVLDFACRIVPIDSRFKPNNIAD